MVKVALVPPSVSARSLLRIALLLTATLLGVAMCTARPQSAIAASANDDDDAINWAYYGDAEVWLRHKAADPRQRELVFKATADAAPQLINVAVPQHETHLPSDWSERLALGLDRAGQLVAVVTSRRGLYWTRIKRAPMLHRVPGTTKDDSYPSLFRGRLAYNHQRGTRSSVRVGSLSNGRARALWTNASDRQWVAVDTAVGAGGAVAFAIGSDGAEQGLYDARLARPDKRLVDIWPGDHHDGPISFQLSTNGHRLTVAASGSHTVIHYALPTGHRLR